MKLHQNQIVHMDINPLNVMFRNKYQTPVFIDFGFSEIITEPQGFYTFTYFRGTLEYVSD